MYLFTFFKQKNEQKPLFKVTERAQDWKDENGS